MDKINSLLAQVNLLNKFNDKLIEITASNFNVFDICNIYSRENANSRIIAEMLNPNGGNIFYREFLRELINTISAEKGCDINFNINKDYRVYTEYANNVDGRIDILIENGEQALIIENKIYATDQDKQLIRYDQFAEKRFKKGNYSILYLTLDGSGAGDESAKGVDYFKISYKTTLDKWLEKCLLISAFKSSIREVILQYKKHINKLTGIYMDAQYKNELLELCSRQENIKSAFQIAFEIEEIKKWIITRYLIPQLKEIAIKRELIFDEKEAKEMEFVFKKEEWINTRIKFRSDGYFTNNRYFGLVKPSEKFPMYSDENTIIKLGQIGEETDWWFCYKPMERFRNWTIDDFANMHNGEIAKDIENKIDEVLEITKGLNL